MKHCLLGFLALLSVTPQIGKCQSANDFEKGLTAFQSYNSANFDSVNLASGNLNLSIPLLSYKQLGSLPPVTLSLTYSGMSWAQVVYASGSCEGGGAEPGVGGCIDRITYQFDGAGVTPVISPDLEIRSDIIYDNNYAWPVFDFSDTSGSLHHAAVTAVPSPNLVAVDASGIVATNETLTDRNGISYKGNSPLCGGLCLPTQRIITDPTGNSITENGLNAYLQMTSLTDSIGRVIPFPMPVAQTYGNPNVCGSFSYPGVNGTPYIITTCLHQQTASTSFGEPGTFEASASFTSISSVSLPNNKAWNFIFNTWGDLSDVATPTGASVHYDYITWPFIGCSTANNEIGRAVQRRDVYTGSNHLVWTYRYQFDASTNWARVTTVTNPDQTIEVHVFDQANAALCGTYETEVRYYNADGSLAETIDKTYTTTGQNPNADLDGDMSPTGLTPKRTIVTRDGQIVSDICTIYDGNTDTGCTGQDSFVAGAHSYYSTSILNPVTGTPYPGVAPAIGVQGSLLYKYERDGSAAANVLRKTTLTYAWQNPSNAAYENANLLAPITSTQIQGAGSSGQLQQQSYTSVSHDDPYWSPGCVCGLPTSVTGWNPLSTDSTVSTRFNNQGMPTSSFDANVNAGLPGNAVTTTYDSTGLYPSLVEQNPTFSQGSFTNHRTWYSYDANTGELLSQTDENGNNAGDAAHSVTYQYKDPLGRLTAVNNPDGGWTSYGYDDQNLVVSFSRAIDAGQVFKESGQVDALARTTLTQLTSDSYGTVSSRTTYDSGNRVYQQWSPTRCDPAATVPCPNESTWGVTSFQYDALSRRTLQINPDDTPQRPSRKKWSYIGRTTTMTDEANNSWVQSVDNLGNLTQVTEPGGLLTSYTYDALGNLQTVIQRGLGAPTDSPRSRSYAYDYLSRLICAADAEQTSATCTPFSNNNTPGPTTFTYDPDGNLLRKTNPALSISFTYDRLSRLVARTYVSGSFGAPSACYLYDSATVPNGRGRLSQTWTQAGANDCSGGPPANGGITSRTVLAYDAMGRLLTEKQCTPANCNNSSPAPYTFHYWYDLAGDLIHSEDGIGQLSWTPQYDAVGRLSGSTASTTLSGSFYPSQLFAATGFTPAGSVTSWINGSSPSGLPPALSGQKAYDAQQRVTQETVLGRQ